MSFVTIDISCVMGIKLSPYWFESFTSSFTKAMIFHFPELFGGRENLALLYSYLDDFLGGAGHYQGSFKEALEISARQISCLKEVGR